MALSMNPLYVVRRWTLQDMNRLMKCKGTIQDVDGECTFKVSGVPQRSCCLAAHYRMPLHALNKKFGLYRRIVTHLDVSQHTNASRKRDTYLSIMDYMHNVRIGFIQDASRSPDASCGTFRSPILDYYLWLDHTVDGFHAGCRSALEETHSVTFEGLKNATCPDILVFRQ
jgi:hypothetical protein